MSDESIGARVANHLSINTHMSFTTADIAKATGLETKQVSSALSKLVKSGVVIRNAEGRYTVPAPAPAPESDEMPAAGTKNLNVSAWKAKIAKMLAKAERTDNDHERETFLAAAEKMMLRLGIHRAELEAVGEVKKEEIVEHRQDWHGNYSIVMVPFVSNVAHGFGGLTILQSTRDAMLRRTFVIGPKSQVEEFDRLVQSLHIQALAGLKRYQKDTREQRRTMTEMDKYISHRSFLQGFGLQVGERLEMLRKQEEGMASHGAALVIADRQIDVQLFMDTNYGELNKARGGTKYGDHEARRAGREAGKTASLNQKNVDSKSSKGELSV